MQLTNHVPTRPTKPRAVESVRKRKSRLKPKKNYLVIARKLIPMIVFYVLNDIPPNPSFSSTSLDPPSSVDSKEYLEHKNFESNEDNIDLTIVNTTTAQFTKTFKMMSRLQLTVENLYQKVTNLEQGNKSSPEDNIRYDDIKRYLPIKNVDELISVDAMLEDDASAVSQLMKSYYKTIGGSNFKDKVIRILRKSFSNSLVHLTSWLGQRNSYKMSNLNIIRLIKEVVSTFPEYNEKY